MKSLTKQSGQVTVEMILVMVVLVGVFIFVRNKLFIQGEFLSKMVSGPWDRVASLIENGQFGAPDKMRAQHPGHIQRHLTVKGVPE